MTGRALQLWHIREATSFQGRTRAFDFTHLDAPFLLQVAYTRCTSTTIRSTSRTLTTDTRSFPAARTTSTINPRAPPPHASTVNAVWRISITNASATTDTRVRHAVNVSASVRLADADTDWLPCPFSSVELDRPAADALVRSEHRNRLLHRSADEVHEQPSLAHVEMHRSLLDARERYGLVVLQTGRAQASVFPHDMRERVHLPTVTGLLQAMRLREHCLLDVRVRSRLNSGLLYIEQRK